MKIAELVSALEELGTIYPQKNGPKGCITQVLALVKGKEHLQVSDLRIAPPAKKIAVPKTPKATKGPKFDQNAFVSKLLDAKTEAAFESVLDEIKKAKLTNDKLKSLLVEYTGIPLTAKSLKKDELHTALLRAFKAELRHDARAEISRNTLPI